MFGFIWIVVWACIFGIFDNPSFGQILGFIFIGLGGPIGRWLIYSLKE